MFKNGVVSPTDGHSQQSAASAARAAAPSITREETAHFVLRRQSVAGIKQVEQTQNLH